MRPGLQDRVARTLARGRAMAEARMLSRWLIQAGPTTAYNKVTKRDETTYATQFETKGRLRVRSALSQHAQQAGGGSVVEVSRELHIPFDSQFVPLGARATCIEIDADTSDPSMLGRVLTTEGPVEGDQTTARRLKVIDLSGSHSPVDPIPPDEVGA